MHSENTVTILNVLVKMLSNHLLYTKHFSPPVSTVKKYFAAIK